MASLMKNYDNMWKAFIRPYRQNYTMHDLGPSIIGIQKSNIKAKRKDFELVNKRGFKLQCSFFEILERKDPYPCLIYLHCNSGSRLEGLVYLEELLKRNISVCIFDFGGSGMSEGEYISLGWHEIDDVEIVVKYLRNTGKISNIGLWGRSMGAVTALLYSAKDSSVSVAVYDSPFCNLMKLAREIAIAKTGLPKFIINGALSLIQQTIKSKAKFNIEELDVIQKTVNCQVPALFIASKKDSFIKCYHSEKISQSYKGQHRLIYFDGEHNETRPQKINQEVFIFLETMLIQNQQVNQSPPHSGQKQQNSQIHQQQQFNQHQQQNTQHLHQQENSSNNNTGSLFNKKQKNNKDCTIQVFNKKEHDQQSNNYANTNNYAQGLASNQSQIVASSSTASINSLNVNKKINQPGVVHHRKQSSNCNFSTNIVNSMEYNNNQLGQISNISNSSSNNNLIAGITTCNSTSKIQTLNASNIFNPDYQVNGSSSNNNNSNNGGSQQMNQTNLLFQRNRQKNFTCAGDVKQNLQGNLQASQTTSYPQQSQNQQLLQSQHQQQQQQFLQNDQSQQYQDAGRSKKVNGQQNLKIQLNQLELSSDSPQISQRTAIGANNEKQSIQQQFNQLSSAATPIQIGYKSRISMQEQIPNNISRIRATTFDVVFENQFRQQTIYQPQFLQQFPQQHQQQNGASLNINQNRPNAPAGDNNTHTNISNINHVNPIITNSSTNIHHHSATKNFQLDQQEPDINVQSKNQDNQINTNGNGNHNKNGQTSQNAVNNTNFQLVSASLNDVSQILQKKFSIHAGIETYTSRPTNEVSHSMNLLENKNQEKNQAQTSQIVNTNGSTPLNDNNQNKPLFPIGSQKFDFKNRKSLNQPPIKLIKFNIQENESDFVTNTLPNLVTISTTTNATSDGQQAPKAAVINLALHQSSVHQQQQIQTNPQLKQQQQMQQELQQQQQAQQQQQLLHNQPPPQHQFKTLRGVKNNCNTANSNTSTTIQTCNTQNSEGNQYNEIDTFDQDNKVEKQIICQNQNAGVQNYSKYRNQTESNVSQNPVSSLFQSTTLTGLPLNNITNQKLDQHQSQIAQPMHMHAFQKQNNQLPSNQQDENQIKGQIMSQLQQEQQCQTKGTTQNLVATLQQNYNTKNRSSTTPQFKPAFINNLQNMKVVKCQQKCDEKEQKQVTQQISNNNIQFSNQNNQINNGNQRSDVNNQQQQFDEVNNEKNNDDDLRKFVINYENSKLLQDLQLQEIQQ